MNCVPFFVSCFSLDALSRHTLARFSVFECVGRDWTHVNDGTAQPVDYKCHQTDDVQQREWDRRLCMCAIVSNDEEHTTFWLLMRTATSLPKTCLHLVLSIALASYIPSPFCIVFILSRARQFRSFDLNVNECCARRENTQHTNNNNINDIDKLRVKK